MAHTTQATWSRQTLSEEKALGKLIVNFRDTSDERSSFIVASARAALKALHKGDLKVRLVAPERGMFSRSSPLRSTWPELNATELLGSCQAHGGGVHLPV